MSTLVRAASFYAWLMLISVSAAEARKHGVPLAQSDAAKQNSVVTIKGSSFDPKVLKVKPGTTVEWVNSSNRHTVDADDGSFKSDILKQGEKFQHTFDKPGNYPYFCRFHGAKGGKEMAGKIVVSK